MDMGYMSDPSMAAAAPQRRRTAAKDFMLNISRYFERQEERNDFACDLNFRIEALLYGVLV